MSADTEFRGFPQETLTFLRSLRENNNKEWFEAHRDDYENYWMAPAQAFVGAMGEALQDVDDKLRYDTRANGSGSLMRIYRDTRFSKDKTPYKSNIAMMFWRGAGKKTQHPAFGLQITPDDTGLMAGMFSFPGPMLTAYREAVDSDTTGAALVKAADMVQAAGDYALEGKHYKRTPRGYAKDHIRAEWLTYNGLWARLEGLDSAIITQGDFVDVCLAHFRAMAPIYAWLVDLQEQMPQDA